MIPFQPERKDRPGFNRPVFMMNVVLSYAFCCSIDSSVMTEWALSGEGKIA